jgi:hypothetical protein
VPLRVHAPVLQPSALKDVGPFLPVTPRIDRLAIWLAEHETVIGPCSTCQRSFQVLRLLMLAEDRHQLGRDRNHLVPPLLDLAQDQAAALALGTPRGMLGAVGWAGVRDLRAGVSPLSAVRRAVVPVPVLPAAFLAGHPMQPFSAGMRISAAMTPPEPLELKHDPGCADIQIKGARSAPRADGATCSRESVTRLGTGWRVTQVRTGSKEAAA